MKIFAEPVARWTSTYLLVHSLMEPVMDKEHEAVLKLLGWEQSLGLVQVNVMLYLSGSKNLLMVRFCFQRISAEPLHVLLAFFYKPGSFTGSVLLGVLVLNPEGG